jgi:hypothetical protein
METFIVYNLDTRLPVSVGESIKAELARFETAEKTKIRAENLIAEEISLPKILERSETYSKKPWAPLLSALWDRMCSPITSRSPSSMKWKLSSQRSVYFISNRKPRARRHPGG